MKGFELDSKININSSKNTRTHHKKARKEIKMKLKEESKN